MFFTVAVMPFFFASFAARSASFSELPDSVPYKTKAFTVEATGAATEPRGAAR